MDNNDIVIVEAKRTPIGSFLGGLSKLSAPMLSSHVNKNIINSIALNKSVIDEIIMGCVLSAGIGQAPARQAALFANLAYSVCATTINKMCGSGMQAINLAFDSIKSGRANIILAGGMESMSNAPYLLPKVRNGYRLGHKEIQDHMFLDGLEDAYHPGKLMGYFADETAKHYKISRETQDEYAKESMLRALNAQETGAFNAEIVAIDAVEKDESPQFDKLAKVCKLKPAFNKDGTVTAANSSSIADGAASILIMKYKTAVEHGLKPLAKIVSHTSIGQDPAWFTTAPIYAIKKLLDQVQWNIADVDLFEINEAFAVVAILAMQELKLDYNKLNIYGGACALGHPIGASGARILVTLIHALKNKNKQKGIASVCIGGGEASAIAIEMV